MKFYKTSVLCTFSAMMSPFMAVCLSVYYLGTKAKPSWIAFSFSLALIYTYLPVLWDTRNHFADSYLHFWDLAPLYTVSLAAFAELFNFEYMFSVFLTGVVIIYILSISIGNKLVEAELRSKAQYYLLLVLFLLTLEYRSLFDIQKTTAAVAVFLLGIQQNKRVAVYLMFFAASVIHPFSAIFSIAYVLGPAFAKLGRRASIALLLAALGASLVFTSPGFLAASGLLSIIPQKAVFYLSSDISRFSSESTSALIMYLRTATLAALVVIFSRHLRRIIDANQQRLIGAIIALSLLGIVLSRNEVFLERFVVGLVILSAYAAIVTEMPTRKLVPLVTSLFVNVSVIGLFTLMLVHSDSYDVVGDRELRIKTSAKAMFFPTLMLLDINRNGWSDAMLFDGPRASR